MLWAVLVKSLVFMTRSFTHYADVCVASEAELKHTVVMDFQKFEGGLKEWQNNMISHRYVHFREH